MHASLARHKAHATGRTCERSSRRSSLLVEGLTLRMRSVGVTYCVASKAAWPWSSVKASLASGATCCAIAAVRLCGI